jgi:hypothetical protein
MDTQLADEADYELLTAPGASVTMRLSRNRRGRRELQLLGNRMGLLSLANILLWLWANTWRREFMTLGELPFVHVEGPLAVCLRVTMGDEARNWGCITTKDRAEQLEWAISEDDLRSLALVVHALACQPHVEYADDLMAASSEF